MSRFRFFSIVTLLIAISYCSPAQNLWVKTNGPFGGNITAIANSSTNDVYLGTHGDGLYKLSSDGESWVRLNEGLSDTCNVTSIAIKDNTTLFATTSEQGIFRSTNKGSNWESVNTGFGGTMNLTCVAVHSTGVLIAGSYEKAVFVSADNGAYWTNYNAGLSPYEKINCIISYGGIAYIGTDHGIFISSGQNIGVSWAQLGAALSNKVILSLIKTSSNIIYAGTSDGFFVSTDNGNTWTEKSTGLTNKVINSIAKRVNGELAVGTNAGVFVSTNKVTSWVPNKNGLDAKYINVVSCNASDDMIAGSNYACYKNNHNDNIWLPTNVGIGSREVYSLTSINNKGEVFVGTDMGIYKTTNNGETWIQLNNGLANVLRIASITTAKSKLYAGTIGDGLYQSSNNGLSWTKIQDPALIASTITTLDTNMNGEVIAGTKLQSVFLSVDEGLNWYPMTNGLGADKTVLSMAVSPYNGDIYLGTDKDGLYRRSAGQSFWTKITSYTLQKPKSIGTIAISNTGMVYVGTDIGMFVSQSDAQTWNRSNTGLYNPAISMVIDKYGDAFAGLAIPDIYQSSDSGYSWNRIGDNGLGNYQVLSLDINDKGYIFAGTKGSGIYISHYRLIGGFTATPTLGDAPMNVSFTDITNGTPTSWYWEFGDGKTSRLQNPSHNYTIPGTYTVKFAVYNGVTTDTIIKVDYITVKEPPAVVADFKGVPTSGQSPLTVQFTDLSTGSPTSWSWDFGDGTSNSTLKNPKYTYNSPGTYTVKLTVTKNNKPYTITRNDYILVTERIVIKSDFTATPTQGKAPLLVTFSNLSTGEPTNFEWDFGDGSKSQLANPQHTYKTEGKYTVSLKASKGTTTDISTKPSYIEVKPIADAEDNIAIYDKVNILANPNNGNFTLRIDNLPSTNIAMSIVNSIGQEVYSDKLTTTTEVFTKEYNLSNLNSGIYYLKLRFGDNVIVKQIIVVK
jgi:PKD repeat protein/photosystem II stability/assembly factor-like uncharacterized protein